MSRAEILKEVLDLARDMKPAEFLHWLEIERDAAARAERFLKPLTCGGITLDPGRRVVRFGDSEVHIEPAVMDVLLALMRAPNHTVESWQLYDRAKRKEDATQRIVNTQVHKLRRVLAAVGLPDCIHNIHGRGYVLRCGA